MLSVVAMLRDETMNNNAEILKRLGSELFDEWDVDNAVITYQKFLTILLTPSRLGISFGSGKTVREKWKTFLMMGFFTKVNQSEAVRIDVSAVKSFIATSEAIE